VPTRGRVWWETAARLPVLFQEAYAADDELTLDYVWNTVGAVHARNMILDRFLDIDADVLLMCDDDVIPPEGALSLILEGLDEFGIVGAPCPIAVPRSMVLPNVFGWDEKAQRLSLALEAAQQKGLMEVDAIGFGFVAVRRDVCAKLRKFKVRQRGTSVTMGEDVDFCLRARSQGFRVAGQMDLACEHRFDVYGNVVSLAYGGLISELSNQLDVWKADVTDEENEDGFIEEVQASAGVDDRRP
jgi:hypothetical protein